ncbi:MAG: UrcA family protein [Sphingomonadaceae bacterium]
MTNRSIIANATLALSLAIAGVGMTAPVLANDSVPKAEISLKGYDLNSTEGRELVDQRIHSAAKQVCRSAAEGTLKHISAQRKCYNDAVAEARAQVAQREVPTREQIAAVDGPITR